MAARMFAHVGIRPLGDLGATAEALGGALGLHFVEDSGGRYDEFPAYVAEREGHEYALLGVPNPQDDLRENKTDDFELMVSVPNNAPGVEVDISQDLVTKINQDGRLQCWLLE